MIQTPPPTPWASIGLLILGLLLFNGAARIDIGPPVRFRRALTRLAVALSVASFAAAIAVGVLS